MEHFERNWLYTHHTKICQENRPFLSTTQHKKGNIPTKSFSFMPNREKIGRFALFFKM
jgi:hypothetical protein